MKHDNFNPLITGCRLNWYFVFLKKKLVNEYLVSINVNFAFSVVNNSANQWSFAEIYEIQEPPLWDSLFIPKYEGYTCCSDFRGQVKQKIKSQLGE